MNVVTTLTALLLASASARAATVDDPIRLHLPSDLDVQRCHVHYLITGPFGAFGSFVPLKPGVLSYPIEIVEKATTAETLRAYVACSGFNVATIVFDRLPAPDRRNVTVSLKSQATVPFAGKIRDWTRPTGKLVVRIQFSPSWSCFFFGLADCMLPVWVLAEVPLGADGAFTTNLPDIASDPVVQAVPAQKLRGELTFSVMDANTAREISRLKPEGSSLPGGYLSVQKQYPLEQLFDWHPTPDTAQPSRQ